jgi:hypothetical protein
MRPLPENPEVAIRGKALWPVAARLVLEINVGERLPVVIADDEALPIEPRVRLSGAMRKRCRAKGNDPPKVWSYLSKREAADFWAAILCLGRNLRTARGILQWAGDSLTGSGNLQ